MAKVRVCSSGTTKEEFQKFMVCYGIYFNIKLVK